MKQDLEDPYFEDSNEDILQDQENLPLQPRQQPRAARQPLQVLWSRSQEESVHFQVYLDPPQPQHQPPNQIPVLPTPSSVGEDSFQEPAPPSYESVMASSGGGARARVPTGLGIATLPDLEQRRLADKMMRSMVKLKSLLELYKPEKYSPEVCRAKEQMWTEKIERSFLELQEDMYKYKDYAEAAGLERAATDEYDEAVDGITEAVSQYTVEMSARAFSAMTISSPNPEVGRQASGQDLSSNSDSSQGNERRKAVATVEVDTEKLTVDIKSLSDDLRVQDDWSTADDHAIRVAMAEVSEWKKRFKNIQTLLFNIKKTIRTHGLEDTRLTGPEAAVTNLQSELEMTVADVEYEDQERHLFTMSRSKSQVPVKMPTFSGNPEESHIEFEKELRSAFKSNGIQKSEQVKSLKDCLKNSPRSMVSESIKDIDIALGMLSAV